MTNREKGKLWWWAGFLLTLTVVGAISSIFLSWVGLAVLPVFFWQAVLGVLIAVWYPGYNPSVYEKAETEDIGKE